MILLGLLFATVAGYQALALVACIAHLFRRDPRSATSPPISVLKPVYGADDRFYSAIVSHARQIYPEFEILFGVRSVSDSAIPSIERLQREYPQIAIRIVVCRTTAPNGKVGSLIDLAGQARYSLCLVNDSDILVPADYLAKVAGALEDEQVGLVTCLYRATGDSFPSRWEALGIATDFACSALVAPFVGVREFGLGSTLAFRKSTLEALGGFESIGAYIADDYQLGKRISQQGKKVLLLRLPVETHLGAGTWKSVWQHQVRWARTIRRSSHGYLGLPITNASLWALCAMAADWWTVAFGLLALRMTAGMVCGGAVLRDSVTLRYWWLIPARDLLGFAIWVAGAVGQTVVWRGKRLRLDNQGRIVNPTLTVGSSLGPKSRH